MHGFSQGDCTIPDGTLPVGTWKIAAQYNGDSNNDASVSPAPTLTVTQEPTGTTLSTVSSIAYGSESDEMFAVTSAPRTSGTPTGQFKVISLDGARRLPGPAGQRRRPVLPARHEAGTRHLQVLR